MLVDLKTITSLVLRGHQLLRQDLAPLGGARTSSHRHNSPPRSFTHAPSRYPSDETLAENLPNPRDTSRLAVAGTATAQLVSFPR